MMNRSSPGGETSRALADLRSGLFGPGLWAALAWQDIRLRYRRSLLGPFWITASTCVMVAAMGPLYGELLGQDSASYQQYLAVSMILWLFIASAINEAGGAFSGAESLIKQIRLPLSIHPLRVLARSVIVLAHNSVVIVLALALYPPEYGDGLWLLPLGLILLIGNLAWLTLVLAVVCARFRDVQQIVANVVQLAFFVSPVIWSVRMLDSAYAFVTQANPFFHLIEIVRGPLLGNTVGGESWIVSAALMACGSLASIVLFARFRARIAYWV